MSNPTKDGRIPERIQKRMAEEMNKRLFSKIGGNELVSSFEAWIRSGCPSVEKVNEMSWLK